MICQYHCIWRVDETPVEKYIYRYSSEQKLFSVQFVYNWVWGEELNIHNNAICPNESFICSNDKLIRSNDFLIRQNEEVFFLFDLSTPPLFEHYKDDFS